MHSAQLALAGMGEEQLKEASWVAQSVTGLSAYLYGIQYDKDQVRQEIESMMDHLRQSGHG